MVSLQGKLLPPDTELTTLYGWAVPPLGEVSYVVLDDGREALIATKDLVGVPS